MSSKEAHDAWWWVANHPKLEYDNCMEPHIDLSPHLVDPVTRCVEDDHSRNTHVEWWIECGAYVDDEHHGLMASHDCNLDCGGDTVEEAFINLKKLVLEHYGDYSETE